MIIPPCLLENVLYSLFWDAFLIWVQNALMPVMYNCVLYTMQNDLLPRHIWLLINLYKRHLIKVVSPIYKTQVWRRIILFRTLHSHWTKIEKRSGGIWWSHQHAEEHQSFPRKRDSLLYCDTDPRFRVGDRQSGGSNDGKRSRRKGRARQRVAQLYKNRLFRR